MSFSRVLLEAQEIIHFNKPSVKLNEQEPFLEDIIAYKILYELMLFLKYLDSDIFIKRIFVQPVAIKQYNTMHASILI